MKKEEKGTKKNAPKKISDKDLVDVSGGSGLYSDSNRGNKPVS